MYAFWRKLYKASELAVNHYSIGLFIKLAADSFLNSKNRKSVCILFIFMDLYTSINISDLN